MPNKALQPRPLPLLRGVRAAAELDALSRQEKLGVSCWVKVPAG